MTLSQNLVKVQKAVMVLWWTWTWHALKPFLQTCWHPPALNSAEIQQEQQIRMAWLMVRSASGNLLAYISSQVHTLSVCLHLEQVISNPGSGLCI